MTLDEAVREFTPIVQRLLRNAELSTSEREDAAQDVLAIFAQRFQDIEPDSYRAFVVSTARRIAAARKQRQLRAQPVDAAFELIVDSNEFCDAARPDGLLDLKRAHAVVLEALTAMPALDRSLFIEARWRGHSRSRLATKFRLQPGTVASRLARAETRFWTFVKRVSGESVSGEPSLGKARVSLAPGRQLADAIVLAAANGRHDHEGFSYYENAWGRSRSALAFDHCLLLRRAPSTPGLLIGNPRREVGWSFRWPASGGPFAFPMAHVGWSPWLGGVSNHPLLPVRLGRLGRLILHYDVESDQQGDRLLHAIVTFTATGQRRGPADPAMITGEMCVVLDATGRFAPRPVQARVALDGVHYGLSPLRVWGTVDPAGFESFQFRQSPLRRSGRVDLRALLAYLEQQRLVGPEQWITCVQFGEEVWGGTSTTWVRRLQLDGA